MIEKFRLILRAFGWRGLLRRSRYVALVRTGLLAKRTPSRTSFLEVAPHRWRHRFDLETISEAYGSLPNTSVVRERVVEDAERVITGEMRFYGGTWTRVGSPPQWHVNPFTSHEYPPVHWTAISDDDPANGDIKDVWELSRLPFTSTLVRAFVLTGDGRYPEAWWQLVEDWAERNPPNLGVNWRCGQETSLRAIALCFGLSAFADHPSTTASRELLAHRVLGASEERVRPTIGYALSQRNNHAISELTFLLSIRDGRERRLLRLLEQVLDDQFYPDGSYAQQSFTYHRLAVQTLQWLLLTRSDLPPATHSRVVEVLARSRDFLARCSDPVSGWLPNYGPNDGTILFNLSIGHYRDFRPLLASLGAPAGGELDEPAIWLESPEVSDRRTPASREPTTYVTLRGRRSLLLARVGVGRHRSAHGDQMAVDLWVDGNNIVIDPGSYRYTAPPPWRNALASPEVHSLPLEDGWSATAIGRFLTAGMPPATLLYQHEDEELEVAISARSAGDGRLARAIIRRGDRYAVLDAALGVEAAVRWNLDTTPAVQIELDPPGQTIGPPDRTRPESGWVSPLYGTLSSCETRVVRGCASGTSVARFCRNADVLMSDREVRDALPGNASTAAERLAALAHGSSESMSATSPRGRSRRRLPGKRG